MSKLVERLRSNQTARHLCSLAADRIEQLEAEVERLQRDPLRHRRFTVPQPIVAPSGCSVCGLGSDGKPAAYVCNRDDCPTRVTA